MQRESRQPSERSESRKVTKLPPSIRERLDMYVLAASSARFGFFERNLTGVAALTTGAGMLASLPMAQAKIVYTRASTSIVFLSLDLNHDGVVDFVVTDDQYHTTFAGGALMQAYTDISGNKVAGKEKGAGGFYLASALRAGARIGPRETFKGNLMAKVLCRNSGNHTCVYSGPWINGGKGVTNRYLGFRFLINGEIHYGWARIKVTPLLNATLTGYAYETVSNKSIIAGKTHGPDVIVKHAATLGELAAGRR